MIALLTAAFLISQAGVYSLCMTGLCLADLPPQKVERVIWGHEFHPTMEDKRVYDQIRTIPEHPSKEWTAGFCSLLNEDFAYIYRYGSNHEPQVIRCASSQHHDRAPGPPQVISAEALKRGECRTMPPRTPFIFRGEDIFVQRNPDDGFGYIDYEDEHYRVQPLAGGGYRLCRKS